MDNQVHLSKKELKSLDHFQARLVAGLDWMLKNVRYVAYGIAPIIVITLGVALWQWVSGNRADARLAELGKVEVQYDAERIAVDKKKEVLRKEIEGMETVAQKAAVAKIDPKADPKVPTPKAELSAADKARKEEIEKQIAAIKADHSGSLEGYKKFFDAHSTDAEGWNSALRAASILVETDKHAEAVAIVERVAGASTKDTFYQTQSRLFLAGLFEEKGEFDRALSEVNALEPLATEDLKPALLLAKGRLQYFKNSRDDAKATFTTLIEKFASSTEAQKARSLKSLLN